MTEPTPPSEQSEPPAGPAISASATPEAEAATQIVYVPQPPSRLNRAAAWVGIAAGSVFIVAVIFGAGVFVGKNIGDGPRRHHQGHEMMMRQGPGMFPPGQPGGFERGPGSPGPFRPDGPMIEVPRQPGGPGASATSAPPRP